jgi:hopene-associated glycosyltransferase HpnB
MTILLPAGAMLVLAAWLYLLLFHGRFWRADQRLPARAAPRGAPDVTAVIPARNEAPTIGPAVTSLLRQDYAGRLQVVVVDDGSTDGTAAAARAAAAALGAGDKLRVIAAPPLPAGWSGKLWAVQCGVAEAAADAPFLLLTDADIAHAPDAVARLVAKAEDGGLDLVSLMVRLHCRGWVERLLVPAFVFFFQKLYPFPRVNDPRDRTAGAAGGCMLVRQTALARAGGIAVIRGALIDDGALAARIKANGKIWLGLADRSASLRPYESLGEFWGMVARSAYTQLRYSPARLTAAVLGMSLLYLAPPVLAVASAWAERWPAAALAAGAWAAMYLAYAPTWRDYRPGLFWLACLPVAALLYTAMTVDSARRHWRGRGGAWKGRTYGRAGPGGAADGVAGVAKSGAGD